MCLCRKKVLNPQTPASGEGGGTARGRAHDACQRRPQGVSHIILIGSFCRSQLPHKSVNVSFTITNIWNKLMDSCED